MHFAPACALNLVETKGFQHIISRRCRAMSVPDPETSVPAEEEEYDWAAKVTASVSYPDIQNAFPALFKMDADYFLERLFCLVLVTPVPNMGSLASNTGTVRRRDPYQIMMPLSDPCMRELLTNSLPSMERSCGHRQYIEDMLQILPDHAGYRHSEHHCELPTHNLRSDEDEANQVTSLNHKYFLLPGAELVDNDASSLIVGNNSYYLVQLDDDSIGISVDDDEKQPDQFDAIQQEDKILSRVLAKLAGGDTLESSCPPKLHRGLSNNSLLEIQMKRTLNERQETQVTTPFASGPNLRSVSEDGGTQIGLNAPKKWDITVLSSLCRWRSCLCEGSRTSPFLCTYHSELKSFLDIRSFSNTQSDAAKFLPRRNPPSSSTTAPSSSTPNLSAAASNLSLCRRDLTSIRAASTLLQELWDGKLKSTIKTFLKKTTHDMRFKIRLQTASSKAVVENEKLLYCYSPEKPSLIGTVSRSAGDNFRLRKSSTASKTLRLPKPPGDVMLPDSGGTNMRNVKSNFSLSFVTMPLIPGDPPWAVWKCKELFDRCEDTLRYSSTALDSSIRRLYKLTEISVPCRFLTHSILYFTLFLQDEGR